MKRPQLGSGWAAPRASRPLPFDGGVNVKEMIMTQEKLTMRETCEVLGVSRAMIQKLEATGELAGKREGGRVFFDRDQVDSLRASREVAKVQRKQDTADREFRAIDLEADLRELELTAWSKTTAEQNQKDKADRAMEALRTGIDELREAERKREHEATLARISRADRRGAAQGSEFLEVSNGPRASRGGSVYGVPRSREKK
jgi:excisionase family DNA binding protein